MRFEVGGEAVRDGGRGTHQQQFERHGSADDVRGADHDGMLALHRHADVIEHADDTIGCAGADQRIALGQPADVVRMKAIDILARVDALDDRVLTDVLRHGQLHEDPVDGVVGVQRVDPLQQFELRAGVGEVIGKRGDAAFLAGAALVAHVDRRGGIVANHDHREAGSTPPAGQQPLHAAPNLGTDALGDCFSVDELSCHRPIFSHRPFDADPSPPV